MFTYGKFSSVTQLCPTLCDPMNQSIPGLPVHHQLPEFTQTHVHRVSDAIQLSHPLSSPSPPAPNPSQHQSLFQWVNSLHEVVKVLEFQLQHHSLQRNPRADLLQNGLVGSPCSPRDPQESSPTPQFKSINFFYGRKWRGTKKPLDESERGEWKIWLKVQHSENEDHGIWSHHFMGNRWGNSGNSGRLYYFWAPKSLQMVTAAMKLKDTYSLEGKL